MLRRTIELLAAATAALLVLAPAATAEQRWQCGEGLSVPVTGTRAERDAACRELKEKRDNPPDAAISQEQADRLRQRIQQVEKEYDVDIKVEKLDQP